MSKNVVVIGGGTGIFSVLTGLKKYSYNLSAVVSMADDGGSTGVLREEFGTLPPGDIRRALVALSASDNKIVSELFNYRFKEGSSLKGHSLGNLLLTALEKITGGFDLAVAEAVKILNVHGNVIPVTLESTHLFAKLENGKTIEGETNIDIPKHDGKTPIKSVFLRPAVKANPVALQAIKDADVIIIGPGDLYTSLLPNLIIGGISKSIAESKAKVIYVVNIMTKFGETYQFKASDFFKVIEKSLGEGVIDYCVINTQKPTGALLEKYEKDREEPIIFDRKNFVGKSVKVVSGDFLRRGKFLRHNPKTLSEALSKIIG